MSSNYAGREKLNKITYNLKWKKYLFYAHEGLWYKRAHTTTLKVPFRGELGILKTKAPITYKNLSKIYLDVL